MITGAKLYEHWSDPDDNRAACQQPTYYKGWLIGTTGHALVAIQVKDRMIPMADGSFRTAKLLPPSSRAAVAPFLAAPFDACRATSLGELRRWAGDPIWSGPHRIDGYDLEHVRCGYLYGKPLNRVVLARVLDGAEDDRVQVDVSGPLEAPALIRGDRWIAAVMAMRATFGPWAEAPHYPELVEAAA